MNLFRKATICFVLFAVTIVVNLSLNLAKVYDNTIFICVAGVTLVIYFTALYFIRDGKKKNVQM